MYMSLIYSAVPETHIMPLRQLWFFPVVDLDLEIPHHLQKC
jgi:hypothetical protein